MAPDAVDLGRDEIFGALDGVAGKGLDVAVGRVKYDIAKGEDDVA